jgi:hypothetical protein
MLRTSFYALKRDAAAGVDRMTWETYEQGLDQRIEDLHSRVQSVAYRAQPSRRSYIPKEDGTKRPLAVTALEDKIVQRAVAAVLNEIYEEDFLGFSYGFRPGRSRHDALDALHVGISSRKVNFILDADIRSFLDVVSYCPQGCQMAQPRLDVYPISLFIMTNQRPSMVQSSTTSSHFTSCNSSVAAKRKPCRDAVSLLGSITGD